MKERELEIKKLNNTKEIINNLIGTENQNIQDLFDNFIGSRDDLWEIANRKKIHINNLQFSLDNPYFARIDFISEDDGKIHEVYIGKNGISDKGKIVVTDWRAPISSLYYDAELGECSYNAPEGQIDGELKLKRQFEIDKGNLINFFDVDLVSNDSLLQKYLNDNNSERLKSIVSTIQQEQNDVIRRDITQNLIIQGVAGSGKTTVALHRIAYLVYNYSKTINQNQYLVIGPNPVFMKYIKSVLPDLDVTGVNQDTYEKFIEDYIKEDLNINPSYKKANDTISKNIMSDIDKFKCSIYYKNMIHEFLKVYVYSIFNKDLMLGDFKVISSNKINDFFIEENKNKNISLSIKIERIMNKMYRYIEDNIDDILSMYDDYSYQIFKGIDDKDEIVKLRKKFSKERNEIKNQCKNDVKKYFTKIKITPSRLYKLFISSIEEYDIYQYKNISKLKKETSSKIKKGIYDYEDLASLAFIKYILEPNNNYHKIQHVVIDEAQDLGEFDFWILRQILSHATFSVFGDMAQSIYDYRSIKDWEELNSVMFNNDAEIVKFNKSYRTTAEIMDVADDVSNQIGLGKSEMVIRHGNDVKFFGSLTSSDILKLIYNKTDEYIRKGYKTIAIISKTDEMSIDINKGLKELGLDIPNLTYNDDVSDERFNICTLSNQLAKGLEFDAVIINNVSEEVYSSEDKLDMKLLYVATTRALHELDICYNGKITHVFENRVKKLKK